MAYMLIHMCEQVHTYTHSRLMVAQVTVGVYNGRGTSLPILEATCETLGV